MCCDPPGLAPRAPFLSVQERSEPHGSGELCSGRFECDGTECNPVGLCVCAQETWRQRETQGDSLILIWAKQSFPFVCVEAMESSGL